MLNERLYQHILGNILITPKAFIKTYTTQYSFTLSAIYTNQVYIDNE